MILKRFSGIDLPVADVAGTLVVASALLITIGYSGWNLRACRLDKRPPLDIEGKV